MQQPIQIGDRITLHLEGSLRHGTVVEIGLPDDHVEIELTDSTEAGRTVRIPGDLARTGLSGTAVEPE
jgi:hypothetical protein